MAKPNKLLLRTLSAFKTFIENIYSTAPSNSQDILSNSVMDTLPEMSVSIRTEQCLDFRVLLT